MNLHHAIETYRGHTIPHVRWIEKRNIWFAISGVMILLSVVGIVFSGLNYSIEFEGGARITYTFEQPVSVEDVQATLEEHGIDDAEVQVVNGDQISIRTPFLEREGEGSAEAIRRDLAEQAGITAVAINVEDVGPTWGAEISRKALIGLLIVLAVITLYIAIRFELKMAICAIIALIHDVTITVGVYALSGREVTPETVIAVLTILGFSLYDTVVIYDKIKENLETQSLVARLGADGVIDLSLNQVLMRSVNTSLVVLLPILSLLLFGGETLKDFAFAMFIGTAIGVYSSIFLAAPLFSVLKEREVRFKQLEQKRTERERVVARRAAAAAASTPSAAPGDPAATSEAAAARATARTGTVTRPASKSRRRKPAKRKRR
ncbi:MAG TPA: protein translocase subunit SecF [Actinomycetota bacterium]|nr:protein translocase subunit SecF [Actinomycetota bacterium]